MQSVKSKKKVTNKTPYSSGDIFPRNKTLESRGTTDAAFFRLLDVIRLQSEFEPPKRLKMSKVHHETFRLYFLEQRRMMQKIEIAYLRKIMAAQKHLVNKLASAIRKFKKKIFMYSQAEIQLLNFTKADTRGATLPEYIIPYDLTRLRAKVEDLTNLIDKLRQRHDRFLEYSRRGTKEDLWFVDRPKKPSSFYERPKAA